MRIFAEVLNLIVSLALISYTLWFVRELLFRSKVPPFIRTRPAVAHEVCAAFGTLPAGSVFYDLGCGDGRLIHTIATANPQASFTGVEMNPVPYFLAQVRQWRHPLPNVRYLKQNLFTVDFSAVTHVYTYLYPHVMDELLPKLKGELPAGARLISLDFSFSEKEPTARIPVQSRGTLGKELYVYDF